MLVQLRLDGNKFRSDMSTARSEVKKLESEFKAIKSDQHLTDAGEQLKRNMEEQLKVLDGQILDYQKRISEVKSALSQTVPGSKENKSLTGDIVKLETSLYKSQEHANKLRREIEEMSRPESLARVEQFVQTLSELSSIGRDAEMAYSFLIGDWAKEAANAADLTNMEREQALAYVEKIAKDRPGWYDGWDEMTDRFIQQLITEVPLTYGEVATIMANAMQAGGVAVEDIQEFTRMFAMLQSSTNLTGEEGAMQFGKFLTIMEADVSQYEALASVIVDLGNNVAAKESEIVEVAKRSASTLRAVGMDAEDILGVSASALMLSMEPAAAGSALEKLAKKSGASAEFAANGYGELQAQLKAVGAEYASFYDLQVAMDADSGLRKGLLADLGMTNKDFTYLVNQAVQTEKVAGLMGQTVEEFAAAWEKDPAKYFVSLFETIGQLDESGAASIFETLAELGITEIRESRLASNFALVSDNLKGVLELARTANDEAVALEREAKTLFETTESQRQMNKNKNENFLQAMGEGVTNIRQPWETFWADFKQNMTENLPEWATTGMGMVVGALSGLGDVLGGFSRTMQGIYYTGQVYKDLKNVDWKGAKGLLSKVGSVGKMGLGVGTALGLIGLVDYLTDMAESTQSIQEALNGIQINVDEESKKRALAAFQEVQDAADRLSGKEKDDLSTMSRVVQAGYGDEEMFGRALAWEQTKTKEALQELNLSYGEQIADKNEAIAKAFDQGEEALASALALERDSLKEQWEKDVNAIENDYSRVVSRLYNGMIGQNEAAENAMKRAQENYSLFALLMGLRQGEIKRTESAYSQLLEGLAANGVIGGWQYERLLFDPEEVWRSPTDFRNISKGLLEQMEKDFEEVLGNDYLNGLLTTALESGAFENMDFSQLEGSFAGLIAAVDMRSAILEGGGIQEVGSAITDGIAYGMLANVDAVGAAAAQLRDVVVNALKGAFEINSPSRVTRPLGAFTTEGFVAGMLDKEQDVRSSVRRMMLAAEKEAETLSPRVNAVMAAAAGGSGAAGYAGGGGGQRVTQSVVNNYSIGGADIYSQQGVRKLAQQIARLQRSTNGSIGKS